MKFSNGPSRARANTILMWVTLIVTALVPLALGGNRPMAWTVTLTVLALAGLIYLRTIISLQASMTIPLSELRLRVGLISIFLVYCFIQLLPIAQWLPSGLVYLPPGVPPLNSISVSPPESLLNLITWFNVFFVGYFAMQAGGNEHRSHRMIGYLFWIAVAHAIYAFLLFHEFNDSILFMPKWTYQGSMTGAFVNRNTFATFLASGAVLGLVTIAYKMETQRKSFLGWLSLKQGIVLPVLGWIIIMAALVSTTSRMGLLVGIAGVVLTSTMLLLKRSTSGAGGLWRRVLLGALLLIAVAALFGLYGAGTLERVGSVEREADYRFELYEQVWAMVMTRPWTGYGGGAFELSFTMFHHGPLSFDLIWQKAHNTYLGLFADYGLAFGSLPILVMFISLLTQLRKYFTSATVDYPTIASISVICIAALHALVDFSLEIQGYALYFAAIVGIGVARTIAARPADG
ncbi:O-antigen ligase family protein [Rhizobium sp. RU36D]|uniref:O-antigen ligase family protein n=1 Tax=Rhizobium sp. RU36D TaxID=1907415 RepID=UPI0009D8DF9E|nr:O-antigen ligase family protein [Rhizobium sp. RU36D]SMD15636.1 O-Antigen ligase [Rhizobium sp. RU36D]